MKKECIWHICSNRWNSAITEYALSASMALSDRGWPTVITPLQGTPAHQRSIELGLRVLPTSGFGIGQLRDFMRKFNSIRPSIIFMYGGPENFLVSLPFFQYPIKKIRFIGNDNWNGAKIRKIFKVSNFDIAIAPSQIISTSLSRVFDRQVIPITLGLNDKRYTVRKTTPTNEILILGRLDPVKGHEKFFHLYAKVINRLGPTAPILHVIGEPANLSSAEIIAAAERAGLRPGMNFKLTAARIPDVETHLGNALCGIVSSVGSEVICRVSEEFLLCGTPILVSNVGSLPETIFDKSAGAIFDYDQESAAIDICADFIRSLQHEEYSSRINRSNKARELFSLKQMGQKLEQAILSIN